VGCVALEITNHQTLTISTSRHIKMQQISAVLSGFALSIAYSKGRDVMLGKHDFKNYQNFYSNVRRVGKREKGVGCKEKTLNGLC